MSTGSDEEVAFGAPAAYDNASFVRDDAGFVEPGSVSRRLPAVPVQKGSGIVKDDRRSLPAVTAELPTLSVAREGD
jgi:hypothetical protein